MAELAVMVFGESKKTIERTHTITGKITHAEDYVTTKGNLPGISFTVDGVPYPIRVLRGSIVGGSKAAHFIGSTVTFTGIIRKYEDKEYFNPKDAAIKNESPLALLSKAGVSYSGSLV